MLAALGTRFYVSILLGASLLGSSLGPLWLQRSPSCGLGSSLGHEVIQVLHVVPDHQLSAAAAT